MQFFRAFVGIVIFAFVLQALPLKQAYAQACIPISATPNLYQIDRTDTQATLYFTPVAQAKKYTIIYGFNTGDERYSISFNYSDSSGAVSYTVNGLDPVLAYSFKVRGENGCSYGLWSNWRGVLATATNAASSAASIPLGLGGGGSILPVTGGETSIVLAGLSFAVIVFGFFLFAF